MPIHLYRACTSAIRSYKKTFVASEGLHAVSTSINLQLISLTADSPAAPSQTTLLSPKIWLNYYLITDLNYARTGAVERSRTRVECLEFQWEIGVHQADEYSLGSIVASLQQVHKRLPRISNCTNCPKAKRAFGIR